MGNERVRDAADCLLLQIVVGFEIRIDDEMQLKEWG